MILTKQQAQVIAQDLVNSYANEESGKLSIISDETKESEKGWVFFYNTEVFLATKNYMFALAGNCPIFVSNSGIVTLLSTALPLEEALSKI